MPLEFWVPVVIASIGAVTGVWAIIAQLLKNKADKEKNKALARKDDADAAETFEGIAARGAQRIEEMQAEIDELQQKYRQLESELHAERQARRKEREAYEAERKEWQAGIDVLIAQVVSKKDEPLWRPS